MTRKNRENIYTRVTNKIIANLEQGVRPWNQYSDPVDCGCRAWPYLPDLDDLSAGPGVRRLCAER